MSDNTYLLEDVTASNSQFAFTRRDGTIAAISTTNNNGWQVIGASTPSGGTGPSAPPAGRSAFVYLEGGGSTASTAWAIRSVSVFDASAENVFLDLKYNLRAHLSSDIIIEYATVASPNETTDWSVFETINSTNIDAWVDDTFDFSAQTTTTLRIRVRCDTPAFFNVDLAFSTWREYTTSKAASDTATVTESSLTDGGTISGTYTKTSEWTSSDPTEGTLDGIALTNFSASTGTWSADLPDVYSIAEGLTYPTTAAVPDFGTVDVVVSDVSYNAPAVSKVFNVKSGWAEVTLATVDTVTTEGLYLRINATVTPDRDIATTEKIYYDTVSGDVTVTDDGLYSLDGATNDFDFAVISATNNVDEAFQFSNLGGGGGTIGKSTTISISTGIFI